MFTWLTSLLFPMRCRACKAPGVALCTKCITKIPVAASLPKNTYAAFDYGNPLVRASIRELKYHHRSEAALALVTYAAPSIAEYIADKLQSTYTAHIVLMPIPEHQNKLRSKGFNHSELIATWLKKAFPDSVVNTALQKTVFTLPQAKLNRSNRLKNVAHTMTVTTLLDPSTIYIIIDDVTTTGATFEEARRALLAAGATKILCIALAHGYAHK